MKLTKESLQIQHEIGEPPNEATCLNNIGWIYLNRGDYDDALTYFERALQLREKLKVPSDIADILYNLADTSFRVGRYDQALASYLRSLDLWRGSGDKWGVAIASYGLGTLFEHEQEISRTQPTGRECKRTRHDHQPPTTYLLRITDTEGVLPGATTPAGQH